MRQLLAERTDVDAVVIATGDRWHAPASILAMRAGKDVYCEKPACLTMAQGQAVMETANRYGRIYQTGAQRLSEPHHVFAIDMAQSGRLRPIHPVYADCCWRDGVRHDWLLAGLDMTNVYAIEFECAGPDAMMVTRLSDVLRLVLFRVAGSVWDPCEYWHGACGERFDGPEGWAAAADGCSAPDVSSPVLMREYTKGLAEYVARPQWPLDRVPDFFDCVRSRRPTVASPEVMVRSMNICLAADICE